MSHAANVQHATLRRLVASVVLVLACAVVARPVRAEKVPLSPEELTKLATHIVVGKVNAVYTFDTKDAEWHTTHYVAEIAVDKLEKGDGLKPGGLVYVRYWTRDWISPKQQPPGTNGHTGMGNAGDQVRLYLVNKGYDGGGNVSDGGFNVVFRNGCEVLPKPQSKRAAAPRSAPAVQAAKK